MMLSGMIFRVWILMLSLEPYYHLQLNGGVNIELSHGFCPGLEAEVLVDRADLATCVHRCAVRPWCAVLAFSRKFQLCYTSSTNFTPSSSSGHISMGMCVYVKREDISSEEAMTCTQLCARVPQAVCDLTTLNCHTECLRFTLDNAMVAGNMAEEGSRARATCGATRILVGSSVVTCQNGAWSSMPACLESSCAGLQQCNPGYADGHYWLRPAALAGSRVRVYCHNMILAPVEYITVDPKTNMVLYGGSIKLPVVKARFQKIRIDLATMTIEVTDKTFAVIDIPQYGNVIRYGSAYACINRFYTAGYFSIDTAGTGLVVDRELKWKMNGWMPAMRDFHRSADGRQISAWCGGHCGWCEVNGTLTLRFNPLDNVSVGEAVEPVCV